MFLGAVCSAAPGPKKAGRHDMGQTKTPESRKCGTGLRSFKGFERRDQAQIVIFYRAGW